MVSERLTSGHATVKYIKLDENKELLSQRKFKLLLPAQFGGGVLKGAYIANDLVRIEDKNGSWRLDLNALSAFFNFEYMNYDLTHELSHVRNSSLLLKQLREEYALLLSKSILEATDKSIAIERRNDILKRLMTGDGDINAANWISTMGYIGSHRERNSNTGDFQDNINRHLILPYPIRIVGPKSNAIYEDYNGYSSYYIRFYGCKNAVAEAYDAR